MFSPSEHGEQAQPPVEIIMPDDFMDLLLGRCEEDNYDQLSQSLRYSPKAVRTLIRTMMYGARSETDGFPPTNIQNWASVQMYGWMNDFISEEETPILGGKEVIRDNLPQSKKDHFVATDNSPTSNFITSNIDAMVPLIEQKRAAITALGGDPKLVFFHGKFNCVPHPGYLFMTRDTISELSVNYDIDPNNTIVIFACEPNRNIKLFGSDPFMNSLWRASLVSYMYGVDGVCIVDEYDPDTNIDGYWKEKYKQLGVDFMSVEVDDPEVIKQSKIAGIEAAGGTIIEHDRDRVYTFSDDSTKNGILFHPENLIRMPGVTPISTSNLNADSVSEDVLMQTFQRLKALKKIQTLSSSANRNWFD